METLAERKFPGGPVVSKYELVGVISEICMKQISRNNLWKICGSEENHMVKMWRPSIADILVLLIEFL
jgi:hypothetical protein